MTPDRPPHLPNATWNRFRLAGLLLVMTVAILASKVLEERYIDSLREDCASLFRDRLIPATTLFHLSDDIHRKRHILVRHLSSGVDEGHGSAGHDRPTEYTMGRRDASIGRLVVAIENTYLVDEESRLLEALKTTLARYRELERDLLERHRRGEAVAYGGEIQAAFDEVRQELLGLTEVQEDVGQQLDRSSFANATHVSTLLYFQLGVAFVLGLLASALAMSLGPRCPTRRHPLTKVGDDPA